MSTRDIVARAGRRILQRFGFEVVRAGNQPAALPPDLGTDAASIIQRVRAYTMTSPERLFALIEAVRYIVRARIPGGVVECGVWRGGSMMAAAFSLIECGERSRDLYLFDTFEGMPAAGPADVALDGKAARELMREQDPSDPHSVWCRAQLDEVRDAMTQTGYDAARIHYVQGKVEQTIPAHVPVQIALLRLDTDWYESTRHELEHLYPRLSPGGVLIIDDYGHWAGCRKAVDEYFAAVGDAPLLNRIDYTGRIAVKPG